MLHFLVRWRHSVGPRYLTQWNLDLTKCLGTGEIGSLYRGFIISGFFSIYYTIIGLKIIVRYTEDFVVERFVKSRFHCRVLSIRHCIEAGYNKIRIPQAVLVPLLIKKIRYVCGANAVLDSEHESSYTLKPTII